MIPLNRPTHHGRTVHALEALETERLAGDGPFTARCARLLEGVLHVDRVLLTTSCTHALEMAALLLDVCPGDEVIVPAFTFVSTINAFVLRGAKPVFCDIRPDTLNIDETQLEALITPRTTAIVPVHYAGVGCEMDAILDVARRHGIPVIEDNAHGLFGRYRDRYLGTFGTFATQSFHESKNFTCGEGGALLINDRKHIERAEVIREKGTDRTKFFRGEIDKYSWVDSGSSYLPADILAAVLLGQLEVRDEIQSRRRQLWNAYYERLYDWALANDVQLPTVPSHCEQAYHLFYLILRSAAEQHEFIARLRERGIHSTFHYQPLHTSRMGRCLGGVEGQCPVTESVSERLVRLPFYTSLSGDEQEQVIAAVLETAAVPR